MKLLDLATNVIGLITNIIGFVVRILGFLDGMSSFVSQSSMFGVDFLDIFAKLSYMFLCFLVGISDFQSKNLNNVLIYCMEILAFLRTIS